jgi:hypothetical protein
MDVSVLRDVFGQPNVQAIRPGTHGSLNAVGGGNTSWRITADEQGLFYVVVVASNYPRRVAVQFLEDLQQQFNTKAGAKAMSARENGLTSSTKTLVSKLCAKYDHVQEIDALSAVQAKVDDVKLVMQENVDQALANCVKLENIETRAEELQQQAGVFKKNAKDLRKKMWWKNCKTKLVLVFIFVIICTAIGLIATASLGGFKK